MDKEPLLDATDYYSTNQDFRNLPEFSKPIWQTFQLSWTWVGLSLVFFAKQYFLLMVVRLTQEYSLVLAAATMGFLAVVSNLLSLGRWQKPKQFTLLVVISIFDAAYITLLMSSSGQISPLSLSVLVQSAIVLKLVMLMLVEKQTFKTNQYIASLLLAAPIFAVCALFETTPSILLLLGVLIITLSYIMKSHYIKIYLADMHEVNTVSLSAAFVLSLVVVPSYLYGTDRSEYVVQGLVCIFGGECQSAVYYVIGLVVLSIVSHFAGVYSRNNFRANSQTYLVSGFLTAAAFWLAGWTTGYTTYTWLEIGLALLSSVGCFVYYVYPEYPQALSSDNSK